jgi:CBS domain-containing protein
MTGGAFGSLFAQQFKLSAAERKTLLVAGAAAGMSAIFATPIAAVLLAVELLLFEWKPRSLIPVTIAALTASVLRVPMLGAGPLFPIALHGAVSPGILGGGLLVGLVAGVGSGLLTLLVYAFEDAFQKLKCHWMWWPAIGAILVGLGGWLDPRVLGVGYGMIHGLLRGEFAGSQVTAFLILKALVWVIALGSGTSGGVLAPLLILGGCIGTLMSGVLPMGDAGLWAMVGMTAMMGGTMRSPLTALIFTAELTHDYNSLPVLMAGCVASLAVTVLLMPRSILTEKLARRGQHIIREYSIDTFELVRVGEVMEKEFPSVASTMTVTELADRISNGDPSLTHRQGIVLLDENGKLAGMITRNDLVKALRQKHPQTFTVLAAGSQKPIVAYPDETLHTAIKRMMTCDVGRLPVVARDVPDRVIGYLGRAGILAARVRQQEEEEIFERG